MRLRLDRDTLVMFGLHLLPLLGIWLAGWKAETLLVLYWMESLVVGFWTVVLVAVAPEQPLPLLSNPGQRATTGAPIALFVLVHAGFFMGIHLFFLHFAFEVTNIAHYGSLPAALLGMLLDEGLWVPLAGLFVVRALATYDVLRRGEPVQRSIIGFYYRIVVMQLAIILGGFLMFAIGPVAALVALVMVRLGFELTIPSVEDYVEERAVSAKKPG
jgi:hypothetical protein